MVGAPRAAERLGLAEAAARATPRRLQSSGGRPPPAPPSQSAQGTAFQLRVPVGGSGGDPSSPVSEGLESRSREAQAGEAGQDAKRPPGIELRDAGWSQNRAGIAPSTALDQRTVGHSADPARNI